jgi:hypothetical protein
LLASAPSSPERNFYHLYDVCQQLSKSKKKLLLRSMAMKEGKETFHRIGGPKTQYQFIFGLRATGERGDPAAQ